MALIVHIIIAISSLILASSLLISPSHKRLKLAYTLVSLTLVSGTYLVVSNEAYLLQACLSGLAYLSVVTIALAFARHKLHSSSQTVI